ncbi:putative potassium transporter [Arachis hypogaea]|nr:putative potassium transporter [Arachis hypogaea]
MTLSDNSLSWFIYNHYFCFGLCRCSTCGSTLCIIHHYPSIFKAISPHYIFHFFWRNGKADWLLLGGTVFCITGIWEAQMPSGNWLITQSCQREIKASCCSGFGWMG